MRNNLVFYFLLLITGISAQEKSKRTEAMSFKDLQKQFAEFKQKNNLSEQKYWKQFKRWEYETSLHTNAKGEPEVYYDYLTALTENASHKKQAENTANFAWTPSGPSILPTNLTGYMENGIGRINCIAFHPTNANTYFVGVAQGGVWKTTNNGQNWTPLTDNLPITRISDICIDPNTPNTMYLAVGDYAYLGVSLFLNGRKRHTHYGLGVYKTTDGGLTWAPTGLTYQLTNGDASLIKKIIINPNNTNHLLACGVNGMYKTTNGGSSWTHVLDSMFWDMQRDPLNPNIVYAATGWVGNANIGNAAIYKSTDFGSSWTMLPTNMPSTNAIQRIKLAIAPSDPNYIYALCTDYFPGFSSGLYGIYKSVNAGATWTFLPQSLNILEAGQGNGTGGQGTYDLALLVHPTDKNTVYTGGVNIWGSTDGALTFNPVSHWTTSNGPTLHGDIQSLDYQTNTGQYFACTDGGVYRTSSIVISNWNTPNWPTQWTNLNDNIQITSFYRLSSSRNAAGRLAAGAQDNATFYFEGGNWSTIFGGDGMDNFLDPIDNDRIIGSSQYGNFYLSFDDGITENWLNSNPNGENCEWVTPIAANYSTAGELYIGNENVVKSTDGGLSWSSLGTIFSNTVTNSNTEISALAANSQVIYAARRVRYEYGVNGIVFKSTNGGTSFTNVTTNLPDSLYYTGLEVDPSGANNVYICMAGFSAGNKVFKSVNGGTTWQNISFNLPNIPVNCIKLVPGTTQLMIATDLAVYTLDQSSSTWVNQSAGLPNVIVSDIEFNLALNKVYVSTFGRGIWESPYSIGTGLTTTIAKNNLHFELYPSINKGHFDIGVPRKSTYNYSIINVMGQSVKSEQLSGSETYQLNLQLAPGVYYFKLDDSKQQSVKRFVVE